MVSFFKSDLGTDLYLVRALHRAQIPFNCNIRIGVLVIFTVSLIASTQSQLGHEYLENIKSEP